MSVRRPGARGPRSGRCMWMRAPRSGRLLGLSKRARAAATSMSSRSRPSSVIAQAVARAVAASQRWGRFNVGVKKAKILQTALVDQNARNFLELTVCRGKPTIGQRLSINCDRENGVTRRSPSIRAGTRGVPSRPEERTPWGKGCRSATPRELLGFPSYRLRNQRAHLPRKRRRPAMAQGVEARSRRAGMKD